ncbi:MAG: tetratricopeptide repeat protein [Candidatus Latescibacteria bacterium]|nr:tetratricopeptide repeat protein [Candidatus Latescibacterota bacterium]
MFERAENYFQDKNYQEAIKSYQQVIKQSTNYEPAWFGLQNSYLKTGDLKAAQKSINIDLSDRLLWGQIRTLFYLNQFDTIPQLIFDLTRKYAKSEYINDALELGIMLAQTKTDSITLKKYSQALFKYETDNYLEAIDMARELIVKPNIPAEYSYLLLANLFIAKNEVNQAVGTLNEFSVKFPLSRLIPRARYKLGVIYLELLQDTIMAKDLFEDLISDFPQSPESYFARSRLALLSNENKSK